MVVIDSQVHAYERDHPGRPWAGILAGPDEVTGDDMVAAMDAVGVDGALLVSPFMLYRYDPSYILDVGAAHPDRFGLITPIDPNQADVSAAVEDWASRPGAVGVRLIFDAAISGTPTGPDDAGADPTSVDHPGVSAMAEAAGRLGLPLNVLAWGHLAFAAELARRHPDTRIVIDHLGLPQRFRPPVPEEPFADLPHVLALAELDNVVVKISGAGTLSTEGHPFDDVWPALEQIFAAYGLDRCLWGTDWTRATGFLTYAEGVDAFRHTDRLSDADKATLMGDALERVYRWAPTVAAT